MYLYLCTCVQVLAFIPVIMLTFLVCTFVSQSEATVFIFHLGAEKPVLVFLKQNVPAV